MRSEKGDGNRLTGYVPICAGKEDDMHRIHVTSGARAK